MPRRLAFVAWCLLAAATPLGAQPAVPQEAPPQPAATPSPAENNGTFVVRVRSGAAPVSSATVSAAGLTTQTDVHGEARLILPAGPPATVTIERSGFALVTFAVDVPTGGEVVKTVQLQELRLEDRVTVISSTRSGTMIEDQPTRVEAVPQEEIQENQSITPGNITTLLNELAGARVQTTVPSLGGSDLRLQGMHGRYTQILCDELPIYGLQPSAFNLLQVPPLDLAQVEVIKGTTSALYGGSALGGVVNLVSRRPGGEPEFLFNQTSHLGTDAVSFVPGKERGRWGYTLLGSAHYQEETDVDGDAWADVPGYRRVVVRPRLFWNDGPGNTILVNFGGMAEDRKGGTVEGATAPAGAPWRDTLDTRRVDAGLVGRFLLESGRLLSVHSSVVRERGRREMEDLSERQVRDSGFVEVTLAGSARGHTWAVGAALQEEQLHDLGPLDYRYTTPGAFVQDEYALSNRLSIAAHARADFQNVYGTFVDPRLSVLVRPAKGWSIRLSGGSGYAPPVPFTEETEEAGMSRTLPLADLEPERARNASIDIGWSGGALELNGALFASRIRHALVTHNSTADPTRLEIRNAAGPTDTTGAEALARYSRGPWHVIASYTHLHATETDPDLHDAPLTPRDSADLATIVESESRGRIGAEISYTGRQSLEDDPYRSVSPSYVEVGILGELRIGAAHIFMNAENLTDVRQTRYDPLLLPAQMPDGRWTTDVWAPLEGRVFNAGVRMEF